jgi:hypothetical protein
MMNADTGIAPIVHGAGRHKNFNTSLTYQKANPWMCHKYDNAIHGKHAKSPPPSPTCKKMARFNDHTKPTSLIVASKMKEDEGIKHCWNSVPILNDSDSISTNNNFAAAITTYHSAENLPMVTPANAVKTKTIVNQNHLNKQTQGLLELNLVHGALLCHLPNEQSLSKGYRTTNWYLWNQNANYHSLKDFHIQ